MQNMSARCCSTCMHASQDIRLFPSFRTSPLNVLITEEATRKPGTNERTDLNIFLSLLTESVDRTHTYLVRTQDNV